MGPSTFTVQQPVFRPPTVQIVLTADADGTCALEPPPMIPAAIAPPAAASMFDTPHPMPQIRPTSVAGNNSSNGYVMAYEATMPAVDEIVQPTAVEQPQKKPLEPATIPLTAASSTPPQQLAQQQQQQPPELATSNGYLQWNPITAAALSASAAAAAAASSESSYISKDAVIDKASDRSMLHVPTDQSDAVAAAAAAMADKTGISGKWL